MTSHWDLLRAIGFRVSDLGFRFGVYDLGLKASVLGSYSSNGESNGKGHER